MLLHRPFASTSSLEKTVTPMFRMDTYSNILKYGNTSTVPVYLPADTKRNFFRYTFRTVPAYYMYSYIRMTELSTYCVRMA
jgi:hypothetical protein